jgi:hypothetical protein
VVLTDVFHAGSAAAADSGIVSDAAADSNAALGLAADSNAVSVLAAAAAVSAASSKNSARLAAGFTYIKRFPYKTVIFRSEL